MQSDALKSWLMSNRKPKKRGDPSKLSWPTELKVLEIQSIDRRVINFIHTLIEWAVDEDGVFVRTEFGVSQEYGSTD